MISTEEPTELELQATIIKNQVGRRRHEVVFTQGGETIARLSASTRREAENWIATLSRALANALKS